MFIQALQKNHQLSLLLIMLISLFMASFSPVAKSDFDDEEDEDDVEETVESVTFYQKCKYRGDAVNLKPGVYLLPALNAMGIRDNDISSIQVPKGYKVLLFDDPKRYSRPLFLTRSKKCLKGTGYNNKVSAVVVRSLKHATVYQHCFSKGHSVLLSPGRYTLRELKALGVRNDDISSIRMPSRMEIRLFENDKFRGRSIVRKKSDPCLDNQNFDNMASSIIIARKGAFRKFDASYKPDPPHSFDKSNKSKTQAGVFPNCIWRGNKTWLEPGRYNTQALRSLGIQDDDVSSISVPTGLQAELFEHDNFQGRSVLRKTHDACLDNENFNNLISSIIITKIGAFTELKVDSVPNDKVAVAQSKSVSFGCDQPWRWVSGLISVESAKPKCSQDASISSWIIKGVAPNALKATGVANDQTGVLMLTVDNAGQRLDLRINKIRSTSKKSSEFRYGVSADSPLIGAGRWERLKR